jgi:anaerobic ribonucleoside-triphosphate reductase
MANFLGILQSEWAGAQAFSSFDTYLAPYVFKDNLSYDDILKAIRSFVYNLNVPARWGQSPFTNITLDWVVPDDLKEQIPTKNEPTPFEGNFRRFLVKSQRKRS